MGDLGLSIFNYNNIRQNRGFLPKQLSKQNNHKNSDALIGSKLKTKNKKSNNHLIGLRVVYWYIW